MRTLIIMLLLCVVGSCTKFEDNNFSQNDKLRLTFPPEEAFPNAEKELITTASGIVVEKLDSNTYIYQSDMLLSPAQFDALNSAKLSTRGALLTQINRYWPDCKVYYEFDSNFQYQT